MTEAQKEEINNLKKQYEKEVSIVNSVSDEEFDSECFVLSGMYVEIHEDGDGVDGETALEQLEEYYQDELDELQCHHENQKHKE